ncbi:aminotransferase [Lichenifustis flavocetrariae]|uniref:Aminotransferase n=1 Tax=Lichenifustis flavocetrariae TaxID=2949735 RepID=A0AA41Z5V4_9HYPH|nr:aminotransferase [Lichenifustis flavocetrariae]MCW6511063.1 aminotransferase [Lichenifustis flavocetrariae]
MNPIFAETGTSVFETMSRLSVQHGAINLGQGFPDDPGPRDVREAAATAVLDGWNQYPPMLGLPQLRQAIAAHYQRFQAIDFDPLSEIMVTSGATEALAGALMALIEPGDEVVLFQPMYDAYLPLVRRAGGVPRFVTLRPPHWRFDEDMLARAFGPRTKLVLFNNPLNPTGTVFSGEDLALLARVCVAHDVIAICDDVWEHVVFDDNPYTPLIACPGMRDRTVKIGSAGKIFSLTGWKVGFVMAQPSLLRVLARAHQFITFTTPPNLQTAVAYGLGKDESYFRTMRTGLQRSRDRFAAGLTARGWPVAPSQGTYFLTVDIGRMGLVDDIAFCETLVRERRVAAIPVSAFYAEDAIRTAVRFCFAKSDETLDAALDRLGQAGSLA